MHEYTLERLKPNRQRISKINKELLSRRAKRILKQRGDAGIMPELAGAICLHNWVKLVKQGKIVSLGAREWAMEWDS